MNTKKRKKIYVINLAKNKKVVAENILPVIKQTVVQPAKLEEITVAVDIKVEEPVAELPVALKELPEEQSDKLQNDKKKNKFKKPVEEAPPSDV